MMVCKSLFWKVAKLMIALQIKLTKLSTSWKSWLVKRIGLASRVPQSVFGTLKELHGQLKNGWIIID